MSVQKQDHPSVAVGIIGVSGTGKSTLFENFIRREKARWIFLFDHKDGDLARRFKVKPCFDPAALLAATARGGMVIFNPSGMFPGKPEAGFDFFAKFVWRVKSELRGQKIFGADELDALVDTRREPEALCKILDQGRTFQLDCVFIAQAANGIHNQVRKQFKELFVFMQGDQNSTDWLEQKGFDREEMRGLKNGEWLYKHLPSGKSARGGKAFTPKNATRDLRGL